MPSSQPGSSNVSSDARRIVVPFPQRGNAVIIASEPGSALVFDFDPSSATIERSGNDLVFLTDEEGTVTIEDFFAVGDGELPEFILPGGIVVEAADFLSGADVDITTAADPGANAPDSGGTNYVDDSGEIMGGFGRLAVIDEGEEADGEYAVTEDPPAFNILIAAVPDAPADPAAPVDPGVPPAEQDDDDIAIVNIMVAQSRLLHEAALGNGSGYDWSEIDGQEIAAHGKDPAALGLEPVDDSALVTTGLITVAGSYHESSVNVTIDGRELWNFDEPSKTAMKDLADGESETYACDHGAVEVANMGEGRYEFTYALAGDLTHGDGDVWTPELGNLGIFVEATGLDDQTASAAGAMIVVDDNPLPVTPDAVNISAGMGEIDGRLGGLWGADGPHALAGATFNLDPEAREENSWPSGLTSGGNEIRYFLSDNGFELEAMFHDGSEWQPVFTVALDVADNSYSVDMTGSIDFDVDIRQTFLNSNEAGTGSVGYITTAGFTYEQPDLNDIIAVVEANGSINTSPQGIGVDKNSGLDAGKVLEFDFEKPQTQVAFTLEKDDSLAGTYVIYDENGLEIGSDVFNADNGSFTIDPGKVFDSIALTVTQSGGLISSVSCNYEQAVLETLIDLPIRLTDNDGDYVTGGIDLTYRSETNDLFVGMDGAPELAGVFFETPHGHLAANLGHEFAPGDFNSHLQGGIFSCFDHLENSIVLPAGGKFISAGGSTVFGGNDHFAHDDHGHDVLFGHGGEDGIYGGHGNGVIHSETVGGMLFGGAGEDAFAWENLTAAHNGDHDLGDHDFINDFSLTEGGKLHFADIIGHDDGHLVISAESGHDGSLFLEMNKTAHEEIVARHIEVIFQDNGLAANEGAFADVNEHVQGYVDNHADAIQEMALQAMLEQMIKNG